MVTSLSLVVNPTPPPSDRSLTTATSSFFIPIPMNDQNVGVLGLKMNLLEVIRGACPNRLTHRVYSLIELYLHTIASHAAEPHLYMTEYIDVA